MIPKLEHPEYHTTYRCPKMFKVKNGITRMPWMFVKYNGLVSAPTPVTQKGGRPYQDRLSANPPTSQILTENGP
jgi:hypothetical protein